jgi:hypothetical protein
MTSVYGVTMIGARNQIASKLKEKFEEVALDEETKAQTLNVSSGYLAKVRGNGGRRCAVGRRPD